MRQCLRQPALAHSPRQRCSTEDSAAETRIPHRWPSRPNSSGPIQHSKIDPSIPARARQIGLPFRLRRARKTLLQTLPALVVLMLQNLLFQRKACGPHRQPRLKHECQRAIDVAAAFNSAWLARSNVSASGPWPDMQLCRLAPPGRNPSALASYWPKNQPHEFVHHVAMKPRWPECVSSHHPARRKDDKVHVGVPGKPDGAVSTVKIDGSGWSKLTVLMQLNRAMSYL
jgi:hypothetical protein